MKDETFKIITTACLGIITLYFLVAAMFNISSYYSEQKAKAAYEQLQEKEYQKIMAKADSILAEEPDTITSY